MNIKRTAILGVAGAALVVFIASAAPTMRQPVSPVTAPKPAAVDLQGAELAAEIARLRDRLRPSAEPRTPSRNLFRYSASAVRSSAAMPPAAVATTPVLPPVFVPSRPPVDLVGIAEDGSAEAPVRTAILSVLGQLTMAKVGDTVAGGFRVTSISSNDVRLANPDTAATLSLTLK